MQPQPSHPRVTELLRLQAAGGSAADELLPLVYEELRALAQRHMAAESPGPTIQATALVHEAYLRLVGEDPLRSRWSDRAHFFAAAARAPPGCAAWRARGRARLKHGGALRRVELGETAVLAGENEPSHDELALDAVLTRFEAADPRRAEVVVLRYYAGLSVEDTAAALRVSEATVKSDWAFARAWLHRELTREPA